MAEPTCADCRLWHRIPATAETLGQPARGVCRERPHALPSFIMQTPQGHIVSFVAGYLTVPAEMPCCAHFLPREEFPQEEEA